MPVNSKLAAALAIAAILALPACNSVNSSTIGRSAASVAKESRAESGRKYTVGPQFEGQLQEMIGREVVALGVKESVPMELNRQVLLNINYFLNDARNFMIKGLGRGSKYIPMMKAVFRQKGLPEDLVYIALIESGFKTDAVSHAAAVGPWQFIAATGRSYGLTINEWVDERRDPVKATYAAADYLTALHDIFNSWPLAIAAYNSGEGKILRGMKNYNVSNFWDMSSVGDHLAEETKLYVPSFLAASFIAKDPTAYGLSIDTQPPDQWDEVVVPQPITLKEAASLSGSSSKILEELNPHLIKQAIPPNESNFVLRIPAGATDKFVAAYNKSGKGKTEAAHQHIAQKGETLDSVAAMYNLDPDKLRELNKGIGDKLKEGAKLALPPQAVQMAAHGQPGKLIEPLPTAARPAIRAKAPAVTGSPRLSSITHKVQKGDTIGTIAKRYGVSAAAIRSENGLKSDTVKAGQILKINSDLPLTAQKKAGGPVMVVESQAAPRVSDTHTVASGESLGLIAQKYGMSVKELADLNKLKSVNIKAGQTLLINRPGKNNEKPKQSSSANSGVHEVQSGESLGLIAQKYGVSSKALAEANNIDGTTIKIGQKLKIPGASGSDKKTPSAKSGSSATHTVAEGESLYGIARKYDLSVDDLKKLNNMGENNSIRPGQQLKVKK